MIICLRVLHFDRVVAAIRCVAGARHAAITLRPDGSGEVVIPDEAAGRAVARILRRRGARTRLS